MNNLVSPQQLAAMAEAKGINITALRDEVAKIAFEKLMSETTAKDLAHKTPVMAEHIAKLHATLAWDFADAFMRERYERESIARSKMQANIPDHLGQLNL